MAPKADVLKLIKAQGPITAKAIAARLNISEQSARTCITLLRADGEPIWRDPKTSGFWWKDDGHCLV
jgi:predicted ArsR family transcriptional regulator